MNFIKQVANTNRFENFFYSNNKKLLLFGASNVAKDFITYLDQNGLSKEIEIYGILDSNLSKENTYFLNDIKIIGLETFEKNKNEFKILITNRYLFQSLEILRYNDINEQDIFYPQHTDFIFGRSISEKFTLNKYYTKMFSIIKHSSEIEKVYNMLFDERSKEIYKDWIRFRFEFKQEYINNTCRGEKMYFNKEFLELSKEESLLDIGGLNGDSCIDFILNTNYKFNHIYLVEPESIQIKKCYDTLFNPLTKDKITFYNIAISDKNVVTQYQGNGVQYTKTWTIDSIFDNKKISIIKMDIEGMEQQALIGAKNIIQSQKPKLAICIYHLEEDIWKIPLMISKINPEYKLYIRHNAYLDGEFVLYAI